MVTDLQAKAGFGLPLGWARTSREPPGLSRTGVYLTAPISTRDRFYKQDSFRRPEREILYFARDENRVDARRLVLHGLDKEVFVDWLRVESTYSDLEGIINLLHETRKRFGLPVLVEAPANRQDWVPQFRERNLAGLRKQPWLAFSS